MQLTTGQEKDLIKDNVYENQTRGEYKSPLIFRYGNYESNRTKICPALIPDENEEVEVDFEDIVEVGDVYIEPI